MKYVKFDSVMEIIKRKSLRAAELWDYDAVVVCGEIAKEIEGMDYVELSETQNDRM